MALRSAALVLALAASAPLAAQTDLDALMARVLDRRDTNWARLQQYVLEERETLDVSGPAGLRLYGFVRDYTWFPRDGVFIRSPLRADGVTVSETERRTAEDDWLARARNSRAARLGQPLEPGFISAAYFLRFRFDPGRYAFVGRETLAGRDVLRIEYYPTKLFTEGRTRPHPEVRERDSRIVERLNKVALVTLWIEPAEHQILKYEFSNLPLDFLPGRSLVRVDGMHATMEMGQPFPGVWLPAAIDVRLDLALASGDVTAHYVETFHDYRLASVTTRVR